MPQIAHKLNGLRTNRLTRGVGAWRRRSQGGSLLTFLFHGVFRHQGEVALGLVDPQQAITVDHFRTFVEYFLAHGYCFVGPDALDSTLPLGDYVMATFDDGYYSNLYAHEVLREYQVPATFFISTNHVRDQKCYWWDVVYRERLRRGAAKRDISREQADLKRLTHTELERHLVREFGSASLEPRGDVDRPFRPAELAEFARREFVHLGNHTSDHAILTNYSFDEAREQLTGAQRHLQELCGVCPKIVSYPNGNYSASVVRAAHEAGLSVGITVEKRPNALPRDLHAEASMQLGRFVLWGTLDIQQQCERYRQFGDWRRRLLHKFTRRRAA